MAEYIKLEYIKVRFLLFPHSGGIITFGVGDWVYTYEDIGRRRDTHPTRWACRSPLQTGT